MTGTEVLDAAVVGAHPSLGSGELWPRGVQAWWWAEASACSSAVAWPVGACGLGEYLAPLDLALAKLGCPLGVATGVTAGLDGLTLALVAWRLGAPASVAAATGALGLACAVRLAGAGAPPGAMSAWIAVLALLAWWRASERGGVAWLFGAAALTAAGGLADAAWALLGSVAALAFARGAGLRYAATAAVATALGHAAAGWPFTLQPTAVVEALVVAGSLRPSWPLSPSGAIPLTLLLVAAWQARNGDRVDRSLAWLGVLAWAASLGPRLVGSEGPSEGSHLPLAAWAHVPGLGAYATPWLAGAGFLVAALLLCARWSRQRGAAAAALWLAVAGESAARLGAAAPSPVGVPSHVATEAPPAWAVALASLPGGVAAVLPLAPELRTADHGITWAQVHQQVLLDAPRAWLTARQPPGWSQQLAEEPFLVEWMRFERGAEDPLDPARPNEFRHDPARLRELVGRGLRWWVVVDGHYADRTRSLGPASRSLMGSLAGVATAEGDGWAIWDLGAVGEAAAVKAPPWRMPLPAGRPGPASPPR